MRLDSPWRGPLWLAFLFGCLVSATASGRFSVRLIADGALSFAFVPAFQVAALFVACRTGVRARVPFSRAVDAFFASQTPWFGWMTIVAAIFAVAPPRSSGLLLKPILYSGIVPFVWSGLTDARFFREVMDRRPLAAWRDVALQRLVGWSASLAYFFGIAAWHENVPEMLRRFVR